MWEEALSDSWQTICQTNPEICSKKSRNSRDQVMHTYACTHTDMHMHKHKHIAQTPFLPDLKAMISVMKKVCSSLSYLYCCRETVLVSMSWCPGNSWCLQGPKQVETQGIPAEGIISGSESRSGLTVTRLCCRVGIDHLVPQLCPAPAAMLFLRGLSAVNRHLLSSWNGLLRSAEAGARAAGDIQQAVWWWGKLELDYSVLRGHDWGIYELLWTWWLDQACRCI